MKGFWTDAEGLSITETLALCFTGIHLIVVTVLLVMLVKGHPAPMLADFLNACSWPILTVLAGYFGDKVAARFGGLRSGRMIAPPVLPTPAQQAEMQATDDQKDDRGQEYGRI